MMGLTSRICVETAEDLCPLWVTKLNPSTQLFCIPSCPAAVRVMDVEAGRVGVEAHRLDETSRDRTFSLTERMR